MALRLRLLANSNTNRPSTRSVAALTVVVTIVTFQIQRQVLVNFAVHVWGYLFPALAVAGLVGINVDRVISATFIIGSALAAAAGVMVAMYYGLVNFSIGYMAGMKAFTAAVLGGIGNIPGAMVGGVILGLVESFGAGYISSEYKDLFAFAVLVLILIFRPTGILGQRMAEKV